MIFTKSFKELLIEEGLGNPGPQYDFNDCVARLATLIGHGNEDYAGKLPAALKAATEDEMAVIRERLPSYGSQINKLLA